MQGTKTEAYLHPVLQHRYNWQSHHPSNQGQDDQKAEATFPKAPASDHSQGENSRQGQNALAYIHHFPLFQSGNHDSR